MNKSGWFGIIILFGITCFWAGRLTGKPEVRTETVTEKVYSLSTCLEAVCRSIYPVPACGKD